MLNNKKILFLVFTFIDAFLSYSQNIASTTFIVDPNLLNDKEKIAFYGAIKQVYKSHIDTGSLNLFTLPLYDVVKADEKSSKSISKAYNIDNKKDKELFRFVDTAFSKKTTIEVLVSSNGEEVKSDYRPLLPKLPKTNNLDNIQVIDFIDKKAYYQKSESFISIDEGKVYPNAFNSTKFSLRDNNYDGFWAIRLDSNQKKEFLKYLYKNGGELLTNVYSFDEAPSYGQILEVNGDTTTKLATSVFKVFMKEQYVEEIQKLELSNFKNFYVIDFFNGRGDCLHGNKVIQVIDVVLENFFTDPDKRAKVKSLLIPIPINYYDNKKAVDEIIAKMLKSYRDNLDEKTFLERTKKNNPNLYYEYVQYLNRIKLYNGQPKPALENAVPPYLLNALLKYCTLPENNAGVISSSIYVRALGERITLKLPKYETLLLTAADNQSISIESVFNIENDISCTEPITSYYTEKKAGSFIIGGFATDTESYGMYSSGGSGISGIGHVNNWSRQQGPDCIKNEVGNSFATPEIATYLWIAQAYWRSKNYQLSAYDTKEKFLLSSQISTTYVSKFGTGGLLDLNQLFFPSTNYGIKQDSSLQPLEVTSDSRITVNGTPFKFGKQKSGNTGADSGVPEQHVIGVTSLANKVYLLFDESYKWVALDVNNIKLSLKLTTGEQYSTVQALLNDYKKVVIY